MGWKEPDNPAILVKGTPGGSVTPEINPTLVRRREYLVDTFHDSQEVEFMERARVEPEKGNAYSSELETLAGTAHPLHAPVIDIDLPCRLIESSTPGHFHLYIDVPMSWPAFHDILVALTKAGVVEKGYLDACKERQAAFVRKPGVKKEPLPEPYDPHCERTPDEIDVYVTFAHEGGYDTPADYVRAEEGTYNKANGHFLCDECYIKAGQPSGPGRWVCP